MAGSTVMRVCECRFCGRDNLTPQGIKMHETYCDDNPHPGIAPEQQAELREQGLLD